MQFEIETMLDKRIETILFYNADEKFKAFTSSLMPTVDRTSVVGVRMPQLRKIANDIVKEFTSEEINNYLNDLPHKYYEENLLHAMIVSECKDYDEAIVLADKFLPYIDNWAVCDTFKVKVFERNKTSLWQHIEKWLTSDKTYTVRFAIVNAMRYFLDDDFSIERYEKVVGVKSDEYYVNMAIAWYISVALVKQYDVAIKTIEQKTLDRWAHNKSIQKAIESYRISDEKKKYLKSLKY